VQRWPRKRRTRDPLRRSPRLAQFSPFGGKWHPRTLNPASESFSEQVLTLLLLLGPCVLSWPLMPPCCLLQVAVGAHLGRIGVTVRPARRQTREAASSRSALARACSFSSSPMVFFNTSSSEQRIAIPLAAVCSIPSPFVCSPPWQPLLSCAWFRAIHIRVASPLVGLMRQSCFLLPLSPARCASASQRVMS
jgi:hypothetical protein